MNSKTIGAAVLFFLIGITAGNSQNSTDTIPKTDDVILSLDSVPSEVPDAPMIMTMAVYPGCEKIQDEWEKNMCFEENIMLFLQKNTQYPTEAMQNNEQGRVFVSFNINPEGVVDDVKVVRGVSESLDQAAINVITRLPRFSPALQNNLPVDSKHTIPVSFRLR